MAENNVKNRKSLVHCQFIEKAHTVTLVTVTTQGTVPEENMENRCKKPLERFISKLLELIRELPEKILIETNAAQFFKDSISNLLGGTRQKIHPN